MTLGSGREFLAIPGPTTVPDEVLFRHAPARHRRLRRRAHRHDGHLPRRTPASLPHRRRGLHLPRERPRGVGGGAHQLLQPWRQGAHREQRHVRGSVGARWPGCSASRAEVLDAPPRRAVDPQALVDRLRADPGAELKAVLAVQVDTAAGVVNDVPAIARAVEAAGHPALVMIDVIASLGCMPFEMDAWGIDVAVGGSQKGLMSPPGLAFIAASERARAVHRDADLVTRYWDWTFREGPEHYQKYCGTAPEHLLFGLRRALELLFGEGLENVFRRHALLAGATRAAGRGVGGGRGRRVQCPRGHGAGRLAYHRPLQRLRRARAQRFLPRPLRCGVGLRQSGVGAWPSARCASPTWVTSTRP